jgi:hypothetical protein
MNKKTFFTTVIVFFNFFIFIFSCCKDEFYKISKIEYIHLEKENSYIKTDTISSDSFILKIYPKLDFIAKVQPISSSNLYAFSPCPISVLNCIQENSIELTFNKDIYYNMTKIEANTDLVKALKLPYTLYNSNCSTKTDESRLNGLLYIYLKKEKIDSLTIANGEIELNFSYKTNDNLKLEHKKKIFVNL